MPAVREEADEPVVKISLPDERVELGMRLIPAVRPEEWHPTALTVERVVRWGSVVVALALVAIVAAILAGL